MPGETAVILPNEEEVVGDAVETHIRTATKGYLFAPGRLYAIDGHHNAALYTPQHHKA